MIISQLSATITRHHHHRAVSEGNVGVPTTTIIIECSLLQSVGHSGNIPSLVQIGRGQGNFVDVRIFPAVLSFYSFTKPFSLTQKTGQLGSRLLPLNRSPRPKTEIRDTVQFLLSQTLTSDFNLKPHRSYV